MITPVQTRLAVDWKPSTKDADGPTFPKVVILYDDIPAGQHAVRVLANMLRKAGEELELCTQLWRFDFLEDSDWFSVALAEAGHADIVVIATSSAHGLKDSVKRWVKRCLALKSGTSAAVVSLLGPAGSLDGPDSPRFQFLQCSVREAGLDFFAPRLRLEPSDAIASHNTALDRSKENEYAT
jgi:hypothetical protein